VPRRRGTETQVLRYLARLVANLPPTPFDDAGEGAYLDILDRAIADRHVSAEEAKALERVALDTGLTCARVFESHHKYLRSLVRAAAADSVITEAERQDLESVCDLLGLDRSALDSALRDAHAEAEGALSIALARSQYGSSPVFSGRQGRYRGRRQVVGITWVRLFWNGRTGSNSDRLHRRSRRRRIRSSPTKPRTGLPRTGLPRYGRGATLIPR